MSIKHDSPLHEHNSEEVFEELLKEAKSGKIRENKNSGTLESDAELTDYYQSEERKKRSRSISEILSSYKASYQNKIEFQQKYRRYLFWGCSSVVVAFALAILLILGYTILNAEKMDMSNVVALIAANLSLVVSIIELVRIITKYCFPENDEEYIVKIVESVQANDLETYKESNRIDINDKKNSHNS